MADEPKIENQDAPNEIEELQKRMEDIEMSLGVFNPSHHLFKGTYVES